MNGAHRPTVGRGREQKEVSRGRIPRFEEAENTAEHVKQSRVVGGYRIELALLLCQDIRWLLSVAERNSLCGNTVITGDH